MAIIPENLHKSYIKKAIYGSNSSVWKFGTKPGKGVYCPFSDTFIEFLNSTTAINNKDDFMSKIPKVCVRGYVPQTVLGMFSSILGAAVSGFKTGVAGAGVLGGEGSLEAKKDRLIAEYAKEAGITSNSTGSASANAVYLVNAIFSGDENIISALFKGVVEQTGLKSLGGSNDLLFLKIPYILYYCILSATENNYYEFPALVNDFFKTNGSYGWSGANQFNLGSKHDGLIGLLANTIGTTISPIFDPRTNNHDEPAGFTINLDLVNDTLAHAQQNYNLVQNLMLYNMWVQYGFAQGPSSLYDVLIEGGQRFLMCTGEFSVSYKGMLRTIKNSAGFKPWGTETRIPDIYSLKLSFKSLLPNNLNNYMISVAMGNKARSFGGLKDFGENIKKNAQSIVNGKSVIGGQSITDYAASKGESDSDAASPSASTSDSNLAK